MFRRRAIEQNSHTHCFWEANHAVASPIGRQCGSEERLSTSRMSIARGRPRRLLSGAGIKDSTIAHWASVRSDGYAFRFSCSPAILAHCKCIIRTTYYSVKTSFWPVNSLPDPVSWLPSVIFAQNSLLDYTARMVNPLRFCRVSCSLMLGSHGHRHHRHDRSSGAG